MIKIIDCGSQLTQNIARRIRELGVCAKIIPHHTQLTSLLNDNPRGIIISGGQFSVYDQGSPLYEKEVLYSGIPILGICYGQQSISYLLGGDVKPAQNREYGETKIKVVRGSPIFNGIENESVVWMSHGDIVEKVPPGFEITAISENKHIASMQNLNSNVFAVQFHPEVDHTQFGKKMLDNFLNICNAERNWKQDNLIDSIIKDVKSNVGNGVAIAGVSGGTDSTILAVLMQKALGNNFKAIFVNNGLLRKNEDKEVVKNLEELGINFTYVDASGRFLEKLKGVTNPDKKRKIIGEEFIAVFEEEAKKLQGVKFLGQGTLYPDVIESVPIHGSSSKIKRHHNVGGLPGRMNLELIEPFRELFKDEVRKIGEELGVTKDIVWRHPFPGPGLAVRIVGEVTQDELVMLREADAIFIEELKKKNIYYEIGQAFAVLTNAQSIGVMGDEGNYQGVIALRAITTNDYMTSDWYDFKKEDLTAIANRIINEVKGINRVVYDISQKPPSTIEWE